jgi:hypothetical protein
MTQTFRDYEPGSRDVKRLANLKRRVERARKYPINTCPFSRHLHMMADYLSRGQPYPMLQEEPQHCAETMLFVLESLWKLRTKSNWGVDQ